MSESRAEGGKEAPSAQAERWRRIGSSEGQQGGGATKVTIIGNAILTPATIEHQGATADVLLLLDTGSARTVVSTDIARRLNMNLAEAKRIPMQVVGGGIIEGRQVRLGAITVGPHTKKDADILVIQHAGSPVKHDGLLGMDLLRGLKYSVDFQKQIITWE
jgi:predicted aspartyl protease